MRATTNVSATSKWQRKGNACALRPRLARTAQVVHAQTMPYPPRREYPQNEPARNVKAGFTNNPSEMRRPIEKLRQIVDFDKVRALPECSNLACKNNPTKHKQAES